MKKLIKLPIRYLPFTLSKKDKKKQINMLDKSKKLYKKKNIIHEKSYLHILANHLNMY